MAHTDCVPVLNRCDLDSHADTCVAGSNTAYIADDGRTVTVRSFASSSTAHRDIPIATVATKYDCADGQSYILIIHEALYFGDAVETTLLTPNQLRSHGIIVDDTPRQHNPASTHSIYDPVSKLRIPLLLYGVSSGFESFRPTEEEYKKLPHVVLTSDNHWRPHSNDMARAEAMVPAPKIEVPEPLTPAVFATWDELHEHRAISSINAYDRTLCAHGDYLKSAGTDLYERTVCSVNIAKDDIIGNGLSGSIDTDVYPESFRRVQSIKTLPDHTKNLKGYKQNQFNGTKSQQHIITPESLMGLQNVSHETATERISLVLTDERRSVITPSILAQRFAISLESAKATLHSTTQYGIRNVNAPGERKVRQRLSHLEFPRLNETMFSDTMFANVAAIGGLKAAQVYTNGSGYDFFFPMMNKGKAESTIKPLVRIIGTPNIMITDGAAELTGGAWAARCRQLHIQSKITQPYSPWQNAAEASIRELKKGVRRAMRRSGSPRKLWDYCGMWVAAVRRITSMDKLNGRTPHEAVTGTTPDISQYALFDWYEPILYYEPLESFPSERKIIGRFIGVSENSSDEMAFLILAASGKILVRKSVWAVTGSEFRSEIFQTRLKDYDSAIQTKHGDRVAHDPEVEAHMQNIRIFDNEDPEDTLEPFDPSLTQPDVDKFEPYGAEKYENYLNAEIRMARDGALEPATVVSRKRDHNGQAIGSHNPNPRLDTREYNVQFADGTTQAITANLINDAIMASVDEEGRDYTIFKDISDHRSDATAVTPDDGYTTDRRGKQHKRITTKGWELLVEWTNGTTSWLPLKDLKNSNPLQVAEYARANKIAYQPAFAWWVNDVMRRRDRIIKKLKSAKRFLKQTKYGLELPRTVEEAYAIDARTGTTFWRDAIAKEMGTTSDAFLFDPADRIPIGCRKITCRISWRCRTTTTCPFG